MSALNDELSSEQKANQMGIVRKQVTTLLGSAQQGELATMMEFLDSFSQTRFSDECKSEKFDKESKKKKLFFFKQEALRNFKDGNGRCAIHFASSSNAPGCDSVVEEILKIVPEAHSIKDEKGATPIILAAGMNGEKISENMVEILLKAGADYKACDQDGIQALHHAAGGGKTGIIDKLYKAGASLDVCSSSGSPLHWAAGEGRHTVVNQLVKLGANVNIMNKQGIPPIIMAAAKGADECVAILARGGAIVNNSLGGGLTVMHIAADLGLVQSIEAMIESEQGRKCATIRDDNGREPIHFAASSGHENIVNLLHPHTYVGIEKPPSIASLMADGGRAAVEHDKEQAAIEKELKDKKDLALKVFPSNLIENLKPALTPEHAMKAKVYKDEGNTLYLAKEYEKAIECYTNAIRLDGSDAVFFSNRSACFLELAKKKKDIQQTNNVKKETTSKTDTESASAPSSTNTDDTDYLGRALADAEHCRQMRPDWSKGCFRLAAARLALNLYEDAAVAAYEGLKIDDGSVGLKKILKEAVAKGREEHFKNLDQAKK